MEEREISQIEKDLIKSNKDMWFVQHIEEHLKDMPETDGKAHCKICNTDIDTIAKERLYNILAEFEKRFPNLIKK